MNMHVENALYKFNTTKFLKGVLSQDLVIELGAPFNIKREAPDFTFCFAFAGPVAIIFRGSEHNFTM